MKADMEVKLVIPFYKEQGKSGVKGIEVEGEGGKKRR